MIIKQKNKHYLVELTAEEISAIDKFYRPLSFMMDNKDLPVKLTKKEKEMVGEFINGLFCLEPVR